MSERWEFSIDNQVWTSDGRKVAKAATREQAILISSAPDMLQGLKGLFEHCAMIHNRWGEGCNNREADAAIKAAQAAIAKAEGKL